MKCLICAVAAALFAQGISTVQAKDRSPAPARSVAIRRTLQSAPVVEPVPGVQRQPPAEALPTETLPRAPETAVSDDPLQSEQMLRGSGIPTSPYPAGLSYMMTPQPFRVPYINRIYYPPKHYVHLCPYYPTGAYLGADWYKRLLGHNPWLIHGCKRFNPYLTAANQRHYDKRHAGAHPAVPGHATVHGVAPCPDCERIDSFAARQTPSDANASVQPASEEDAAAETPPLPRMQLITQPERPDASAGEAPSPSATRPRTSSVRFKPARTANSTLPPWQRPPVVRR